MKRLLMYSTSRLLTSKQTGGTKRFLELTHYFYESDLYNADLCCQDSSEELEKKGLHSDYSFVDARSSIIPPEAARLLKNRALLREIKKKDFDYVVAFDVPPTVGLCLTGVKNIVLMIRKDLIGYENVSSKNNNLKKKLKLLYLWIAEEYCLRKAKRIITQCEYDKAVLINRHKSIAKQLNKKVFIQINNVNTSWNRLATINTKERDNSIFKVCFIGNFDDERKGHTLLLPAAKYLLGEGFNIQFIIIGSGAGFEKYKQKYQCDSIVFLGHVENPVEIIQMCHLMVVPSFADSCPNTIMEALYTGVPVIGSNAGGIPEILPDSDMLFELSIDSLADRIIELYSNRELLDNIKIKQETRKRELTFNWAERISTLITKE